MRFPCPTCRRDTGGEWVFCDAHGNRIEFGLRFDPDSERVYLAANLFGERAHMIAEIYEVSPKWLRQLADWAEGMGAE